MQAQLNCIFTVHGIPSIKNQGHLILETNKNIFDFDKNGNISKLEWIGTTQFIKPTSKELESIIEEYFH